MSSFKRLWILVLASSLAGCGSYRHPDFIIQTPDYYDHQAQRDALIVAADPYLTRGKQEMLFNNYPTKKGIYPVHIIFFNQSKDETYDLSNLGISLVDGSGKSYQPLSEAETVHLASRNIFARTVKYGILASPTFFFAVPIALIGGFDTYKSNALAKDMITEEGLEKGKLGPRQVAQGFVFFAPARGMKGRAFRHQMRASYSVQVLGVRDSAGQTANFSIFFPDDEPVTL